MARDIQEMVGVITFRLKHLNNKKMPSLAAFFDHLGTFLKDLPEDYSHTVGIRNHKGFVIGELTFQQTTKVGDCRGPEIFPTLD